MGRVHNVLSCLLAQTLLLVLYGAADSALMVTQEVSGELVVLARDAV